MPRKQEQEGDDPDPTPYLFVSLEQKRIDQTKPYDAKKSCWVPDEKEGFVLGEIKGTKGDLVIVGVPGGEVMNKIYTKKDGILVLLIRSSLHFKIYCFSNVFNYEIGTINPGNDNIS